MQYFISVHVSFYNNSIYSTLISYISILLWNYINEKSDITAFCTVGGMVPFITEKEI
jgi:hypothetical protein